MSGYIDAGIIWQVDEIRSHDCYCCKWDKLYDAGASVTISIIIS